MTQKKLCGITPGTLIPPTTQETPVNKNIGSADRIVRILAAVVVGILILTGTLTGAAAIVLGIVGAVLLVTALVSVCPLYMLLGMSTRKTQNVK